MSHWPEMRAIRTGLALISAVFVLLLVLATTGFAQTAPDAETSEAAAREAAQAMPAEIVSLPGVTDMRVLNNDERARLIIDLSAVTEFAIASLAGPDRVVVDLKADQLAKPVAETPAGDGLVGTYAIDVAEQGRIRAVLTLAAPVQVQQAYLVQPVDSQPARLIVDLIADTPARFAQRVSDDFKAALARQQAEEDALNAITQPDTDAAPSLSTEPVAIASGAPRALIVIDPGHGGIDGGAVAYNGIKEKDVVFGFSQQLQELLTETGRFDVAMTRDDDSFVRLEDRVALARTNKADLFISIHADKFEDPEVGGTALYMRDEQATDELHKILAENENRADLVAGFAPPEADARVTSILVELMQRETRRKSFSAAQAILKSLETHTRLRKIPLHKADFFVLQAPEVPALLIELGFLSNIDDVAHLTQQSWRDETAKAIAAGIVSFFDGLAQN